MNKQYWSSIKTADEQQQPPPKEKTNPKTNNPNLWINMATDKQK